MDFDAEQSRLVDLVDDLLANCKGKGWSKYKGDVVCRVVSEHIQQHLSSNLKVVGPSVYIEGFPSELDLMVVDSEASPLRRTNAYQANRIHRVMEIKKRGVFGRRDELEANAKRIKSVFDYIIDQQHHIKAAYLTIQETVDPVREKSIRFADKTRTALHPYPVFVLRDSRGNRLQKGEWRRFIEYVTGRPETASG